MITFKFKNTRRFSPVIYGNDRPWEADYFHLEPLSITKKFLEDNDHVIDDEWWIEQRKRCLEGYIVDDVVEFGSGDVFSSEKIKYKAKDNDIYIWGNNIIIENNNIYFKDLDITTEGTAIPITGRMYFYLNFWKILRLNDAKTRKEVLNPKFTDLSWENWWIRDRYRREKKDHLWLKARQRGLSEEEACDTVFDFLFFNDSQSVIMGGEEFYNDNTMGMVRRGLEHIRNTQFYKELKKGGDSVDYIAAKMVGSEIYSRTCKNNSQAASGLSPSKAHLEEVGIWKRGLVKETKSIIEASLEAENTKTGFTVMTGTGGNLEDGVADMEDMGYNPDKHNLLEFDNYSEDNDGTVKTARFIPGYRFEIIDQDGNSLVKPSIDKLITNILNSKPVDRYIKIVMKPLKLSHIFMTEEGGYFGKAIAQYCNERLAYINNYREARVMGLYRGEWKDLKNFYTGVTMIPDEEGPFMISEFPSKNSEDKLYHNVYRAGTDSYDQDEAHTSTSMGACWIKKGFINANQTYNKYVAGIVERPSTAQGGKDIFYEHTAMLCIFYNAINLIEHSKLFVIKWYVDHGLHGLLKLKPEFVTARLVKKSETANQYGIDPSTKPHWLALQKDYLTKENIMKCDFPILLKAWAKFKYDPTGNRYNCDNTIATSLCTVCEDDEKELVAYIETIEKRSFGGFRKDKYGNLVRV